MKKVGIYPGTFDPITYGHIDVIKKALKIVDIVIVAFSDGNYKKHLFDVEERISLVKKALFKDLFLVKCFSLFGFGFCGVEFIEIFYLDLFYRPILSEDWKS